MVHMLYTVVSEEKDDTIRVQADVAMQTTNIATNTSSALQNNTIFKQKTATFLSPFFCYFKRFIIIATIATTAGIARILMAR